MWTVANGLFRDMGVAKCYRYSHVDKRFDAVPDRQNVEALFDLGNVYYCDSWPWPLHDRIRRSIRFNQSFPRATIVYLPCGWGPFQPKDQSLLDRLTRGAITFARDQISLDYLNETLETERAVLCPDLAIMCREEEPAEGANLLRRLGVSAQQPVLGLIPNVRCVEEGVSPLSDPSVYYDHLRSVLDWSYKNDHQVVGISHMVETDRDRKLLTGLGVPIVESSDANAIRSVVANLSIAVAGRYHSVVNCLVHGVPVISLGWQHKYPGLMQYFESPEFDHPLAESSGQLLERIAALASSRDRCSKKIIAKLEDARSEIRKNMNALSRQLGRPSSVLTTPVRFENAMIETDSHIRLSKGMRLIRLIRSRFAAWCAGKTPSG